MADIFGRENPNVFWTKVPAKDYDKFMKMPEDERRQALKRVDYNHVWGKCSPLGWNLDSAKTRIEFEWDSDCPEDPYLYHQQHQNFVDLSE